MSLLNRVWLRLYFAKGVELSLGIEIPQLPSTDPPLAPGGEEGGAGGLSVSGGTRLHPGKHAEKKMERGRYRAAVSQRTNPPLIQSPATGGSRHITASSALPEGS